MAGILAAMFGALSGIVALAAAFNAWLWMRVRARRANFWLALFAIAETIVLLAGAVVVERPATQWYEYALFLRSTLLGVAAVLSIVALSRLVAGVRVTFVVTVLSALVVVHAALWDTTDLMIRHPVTPSRWPTYGPVAGTGLIFGVGVLFVAVRALRRSGPEVRRILWFTIITTVANSAVPPFAPQGFLSDVSLTFSAVPAAVGILYLGVRTISFTVRGRDELVRRQATLADLGRAAFPSPSGEWIRERAEAILADELGAPGSTIRIDARPALEGDADSSDDQVRTTGRSCVVSATVARRITSAERRFVESLAQLVAAVADRSAAEADIAYGASHDQLTGLPNRLLLADRLAGLLDDRDAGPTVLVLCRLHGLDPVIATEGHDAADSTTVAVVDSLALLVGSRGFLARQSTDVFALVEQLPPGEDVSVSLGRRLEVVTATLRVTLPGPAVRASVGAVVTTEAGTAGDLLRDAAAALGRATPGGRAEIFDIELGARARMKVQLAHDLGHAVERDEIEVHYQPIVDVRTREVRSYEALARWRRHGELLAPALWIPIAEQSGLIDSIGLHVLGIACRDQRRLGVPVAVNVSALQVMGARFTEQVVHRLGNCPPDQLVLEVTESVVMPDVATAVRVFSELRDLGIRTALDDFGTSYSSLSVLATLPVDVLKIDKTFVDALSGVSGASVVTAVVSLARALGKTTVAEGVETESQFITLAALGVDRIQGYLVGRPAPLEAQVALH